MQPWRGEDLDRSLEKSHQSGVIPRRLRLPGSLEGRARDEEEGREMPQNSEKVYIQEGGAVVEAPSHYR